jgi:hypothetical protein
MSRRSSLRPAGIGGAVAAITLRLWARFARRPVDSMAILGAGAASAIIIVNAVFLQSGPHPAPFFANPASLPQAAEIRPDIAATAAPKLPEPIVAHPVAGQRAAQPVSARRNDPIADLIGSSVATPSRVIAVQRVLSAYGYGQIRPSGVLDEPTSAAIEKFEGEHKLPLTGRLSDRLLRDLASMAGHPLE